MDKENREALMVAKELAAKFIETRTVSPNNFEEVFPMVYRVVRAAIREALAEDALNQDTLNNSAIISNSNNNQTKKSQKK